MFGFATNVSCAIEGMRLPLMSVPASETAFDGRQALQPSVFHERRRLTTDRAGIGIWDEWLMYLSLALLLLSTIQNVGIVGDLVTIAWLASLAMLVLVSRGAAFGVYLCSVAFYSGLHFAGWGSIFQRPDNYAMIIASVGITARALVTRTRRPISPATIAVGAFLGYCLLQMAAMHLFTRVTFGEFMRMHGIPLAWFAILAQDRLAQRNVALLLKSMIALGGYMALISILEHFLLYGAILPQWIDTLRVHDAWRNNAAVTGRAGGLLMQSEFNALALSLVFCMTVISIEAYRGRAGVFVAAVVGVLCLIGIYYTYTRAAWLTSVPSALVLLWRSSNRRVVTYGKRLGLALVMAAGLVLTVATPDARVGARLRDSQTVMVRLALWGVAVRMVADRPVVGSGFNSFSDNAPDYFQHVNAPFAASMQTLPVHNTTLSVLVELGTVGLLLYVLAAVAACANAFAGVGCAWPRGGRLWLGVFAFTYFVQQQFVIAHEPTTNLMFFGVLGVIAGLRRKTNQEGEWALVHVLGPRFDSTARADLATLRTLSAL